MLAGLGRSWKLYVAAGVLLLMGLCVFDWTRWWVFDARIQGRVVPTMGSPTVEQVIGIRSKILDTAKDLWLSPSSVEVHMHCEQHLSNGYALKEDQTKIYWFLEVSADCRGRHAQWEMRFDNALPETDGEALDAAGIKVLRQKPPQGG